MKKINVSVRELPFRLDQSLHADDVVTVSMEDCIMHVETPDGEELTSFEAGDILKYWFKGLPSHRFFEAASPNQAVTAITTKQEFSKAAKLAFALDTIDQTEIGNSLSLALDMTSTSILGKMQPDEIQQHLINLGWEIYRFNNAKSE